VKFFHKAFCSSAWTSLLPIQSIQADSTSRFLGRSPRDRAFYHGFAPAPSRYAKVGSAVVNADAPLPSALLGRHDDLHKALILLLIN
jgi:hypothetical protein